MWLAGIVALLRRRPWRDIRLLVGALFVVLVFTFVGSAQFFYPLGVLLVLLAIGCVPTAEWMRTRARRALAWTAVALNGAISAVIALPLVPIDLLGATPLPAINQSPATASAGQNTCYRDGPGLRQSVRTALMIAAATEAGSSCSQ